ncbi:hypothetical protein [Listeria booriae]|nr:hypothetical protein [Listeria booriae]
MNYVIRLAREGDAKSLSAIRLQIDVETEKRIKKLFFFIKKLVLR